MNEFILEYVGIWDWQKTIIENYSHSLKDGGNKVYAELFCSDEETQYLLLIDCKYFVVNNYKPNLATDILRVMNNFCVLCWKDSPRHKSYGFICYPGILASFDVL